MRMLIGWIVAMAVLVGVARGDEAEDAQTMDIAGYVVGIIYAVEGRDEANTEEIARIQSEHLANIRRLADENKLLLAGPFGHDGDMRGLFFFNTTSIEEAEELVATDPAVQAGRLRVELFPWWGTSKLKDLPALIRAAENG